MITQYRLKLECGRPLAISDAYRLYAALLSMAPSEYGARVHNDEITPIRHYLLPNEHGGLWSLSVMGEDVEKALGEVLQSCKVFHLKALGADCEVLEEQKTTIMDPDDLFKRSARHGKIQRLDFVTPTVFKHRGKYVLLPTQRLIVQNLIKTWNACFPECSIEDEDGEGLDALADGLAVKAFALHDRYYSLKGRDIPGFVGNMTLENRLQGFHCILMDALLFFAQFSGIGAKTSLGMGGVHVQ